MKVNYMEADLKRRKSLAFFSAPLVSFCFKRDKKISARELVVCFRLPLCLSFKMWCAFCCFFFAWQPMNRLPLSWCTGLTSVQTLILSEHGVKNRNKGGQKLCLHRHSKACYHISSFMSTRPITIVFVTSEFGKGLALGAKCQQRTCLVSFLLCQGVAFWLKPQDARSCWKSVQVMSIAFCYRFGFILLFLLVESDTICSHLKLTCVAVVHGETATESLMNM